MSEITARDRKQAGVGAEGAAIVAEVAATAAPRPGDPLVSNKLARRIALRPVGLLFSPQELLVWIIGLLGVAASIAPWFARGWLWFGVIATSVGLVTCYDALALWFAREECRPVLLQPDAGLRGREGETIQLPLALTGSSRRWPRREVRVGIMPTTPESEGAIRVEGEPQRLKLERFDSDEGASTPENTRTLQLWPWMPEIGLLRRGLWPGPRIGIECSSPLRIWRLRRWYDLP